MPSHPTPVCSFCTPRQSLVLPRVYRATQFARQWRSSSRARRQRASNPQGSSSNWCCLYRSHYMDHNDFFLCTPRFPHQVLYYTIIGHKPSSGHTNICDNKKSIGGMVGSILDSTGEGQDKVWIGCSWTTSEHAVPTPTSGRLQPRTRRNGARRWNKGRNVSWRNGSLQKTPGWTTECNNSIPERGGKDQASVLVLVRSP